MASTIEELVLPRPGGPPQPSQKPIPGPPESAFTETFGALLPPAKFLNTTHGKASYFEILPSVPSGGSSKPDRVLVIHGVQTASLGMLPLARALEKSCPHAHLVLIDLWGHGLSDTPILAHEPALFHQLLDELLDKLNWSSAHLVGYSFGGATTASYVASRPTRVQSFTFVAPAGLLRSSDFTSEQQGYLRGDDEVGAKKWVIEFLEGGELVVPKDWKQRVANGEVVAEAVRDWQMRVHPGHLASVVGIVRDGGVMDSHTQFLKAAQTGIPSLAVLGELDDLCSKQQLNEHGFDNVFVIPQVGHGVVRDRAEAVATFISEFWAKLSSSQN
ncbi:hypothetical protein FSARC_3397 [Fusarium sarcochroum]|uniref:AB hydrolase-1 domain-containing protein n=1 Tax=Fusarium sarcochroum TaxID=1208366 RepID=A0A8H4U4H6_9HYPO|nr:hypothetical protein FSARC_3397 [Fusarium sarcochroum]